MQSGVSYLSLVGASLATICFMIAGMHFVLWLRARHRSVYLLATIMSAAGGALALINLRQAFAPDVETFVTMSRLTHVALFALLISMVTFVRRYLGTGPRWLIGVIAILWFAAVVQSFVLPYGVIHAEITELVQVPSIGGETFSAARGPLNPGKFVADAAVILILVFLVVAGWQAAQSGQKKRAFLVSGSGVAFATVSIVLSNLEDLGLAQFPFIASPAFLVVIAALTYMILDDAFRASDAALEIAQLRRVLTLGELAGGLAHEINQPLAAILSNAQAARRFLTRSSVDLDEIREIVDDIIADDKRASDIIHGLRKMLSKSPVERDTADLNSTVRDATALVKGECHANDVLLEVDVDLIRPPLRCSEIELQQVFVNLLLNAIRAVSTQKREDRKVLVKCAIRDGSALCSVADSGPGISDDVRKKLFEPFVSTSEGGLGLGLAVCKRIVERSGGSIWAEDREQGGTRFTFTVPLADQASAA